MRWTLLVATSAALAVLAAAAFVTSCTKQAAVGAAAMRAADRIALGKRLAWAAGCNDCHTPGALYGAPDTTRLLSGSELGWAGPWGVSYARNITPDTETGIGGWTEDQVATAITTGHRPDGTPLNPPMPWPSFAAGFTPDDVHAIAAYLKSIPPVKHKSPDLIPPGKLVTGAALVFPAPPAWDSRSLPPPGGGEPGGGASGAGASGAGAASGGAR